MGILEVIPSPFLILEAWLYSKTLNPLLMLPAGKKAKLVKALKDYQKRFFGKRIEELDESGTRIMINHLLTEVLGYVSLEEVKTEYMIRGTYADYVIQTKGVRHFLVEVKALSLDLSDKHLRQAINYGANEGIEWALLTNGRKFDLYRIIFGKPIDSRRVFSVDLSDTKAVKGTIDHIQFLHRDAVIKKGLTVLWNKFAALEPSNLAGLFFARPISNFLKRELKRKFRNKFSDNEIAEAITRLLETPVNLDSVKPARQRKHSRRLAASSPSANDLQAKSQPATTSA